MCKLYVLKLNPILGWFIAVYWMNYYIDIFKSNSLLESYFKVQVLKLINIQDLLLYLNQHF